MEDAVDAEGLLEELDLGDTPRVATRSTFYTEYVRDLTEADIAALATRAPIKPPVLARIHASHHSLARCLAGGMKQSQAALVTGYSQVRISQLVADPAFQALVTDYRNEAKSVFADLAERMSDLSFDAIEVLKDRLHEKPEEFSVHVLLDVVKAFADRTGYGPGQDLNIKVQKDFIDRPPRESFEDWKARRDKELSSDSNVIQLIPPPKEAS